MGREFGHITKLKTKQVHWTISPFEQKAFAGAISKGFPKMIQRIGGKIFKSVPFFISMYYLLQWSDWKAIENIKKYPGQFDNDE